MDAGAGHRRPVHLEAQIFDLIDHWVERYRREAEQRHQRLDALLARLTDEAPQPHPQPHHTRGPRP